MRPASARYLRACTRSHKVIVRARVCTGGQSGTNPTGTEIPILAGDVRLDGTAAVRGTLDLTTRGDRRWPTKASLLLAPYGNEIYVERGILYGAEQREWIGLGYYRIDTIEQDDAPDGPIRITGSDRMQGLIDARMITPRQFAAGTTYAAVFTALVQEVYPAAVIVWDSGSTKTLPRSMICSDDRWAFLDDLVAALGKIWYWDYQGVLQIKDPPPTGSPVWQIGSRSQPWNLLAKPRSPLLRLQRSLTRVGAYNAVVASGESVDSYAPVSAIAFDNDALSPTFWGGQFGRVPEYYTHPAIVTKQQAEQAAVTRLRRQVGLPYEINLEMVPNAALEPWDVVKIRPNRRTTPTVHTLQSVSIPLTAAGAMGATSREQTTLRIGWL